MSVSVLETLCFRITRHCNLSCSFCRAGSSPTTREQSNIELFKTFAIDAQLNLGLRHVSISGGEPGLDARLSNLIEFLVRKGLHVSVTTNGTTRLSKRLKSTIFNALGKIRIRVSIDGDAHLHDKLRGHKTFAAATQEIGQLKDIVGWVGMNTVVLPETVHCTETLLSVAKTLEVDEWALITPVPEGSAVGQPWIADNILPRILEFRETIHASGYAGRVIIWNFIGTPNTSVLVNTNGDIVLTGVRGDDDLRIGSLDEYDVAAIANAIRTIKTKFRRCYFSWSGWQ